MGSYMRCVFLSVILCIIILVGGFLLTRYLSPQYFELQQEVRSEEDSKNSSGANLAPIAEKLSTLNESENTVLSNKNVEASEIVAESLRILASVQKALKYTEIRLYSLFGKHVEDIKPVKEATLPYFGQEIEFGAEVPQDSDTVKFGTDGSGDEPINQRNRGGKFIKFPSLNIFGFAKSLIKTSSDSSTEEIGTEPATNSDTFERDELLETSLSAKTELFTGDTVKSLDPHSQLFVSQDKSPEAEFVTRDSNETELNSLKTAAQDECLNCVTEDFVLAHVDGEKNLLNNTSQETKESTQTFNNEVLGNFCTKLLNKISESQHVTDEEMLNSSQNVIRSLNDSNSNSFSSNSSINEKSNSISEESLLIGGNESEKKLPKHSSLLNFEKTKFESNKLPILKESNEASSKQSDVNLENLPTILDCATYFREKTLKMFPKPNLMDTISDPDIELTDFANGKISPKLKELYSQYLDELFESEFNNSIGIFDRNSKDASTESFLLPANTLLLETERKVTEDDIEIVTHTKSDSNSDAFAHTESELNLATTEFERDSRFINILGFGSGLRSLEVSEFDSNGNDLGSGEAFKDTADEVRTPALAEDLYEQLSTGALQEPRFFNFIGLAGSGEGRELNEEQENETADNSSDCDDDCPYGITTDNISDCGECLHEESHDYGNNTEVEDHILNETYEDCKNSTMEYNNEQEDNFTGVFQSPPENGSFHESPDRNITSFECDECDFNIKLPLSESDEFVSHESKIPNKEIKETPRESLLKDCDDCEEPDKIHTPEYGQNFSFPECDGCNFSNVNIGKSSELDEKDKHINITCEDCNSSVLHTSNESYEGFSQIEAVSNDPTVSEVGCLDCGYETDKQQVGENSAFKIKDHIFVGNNTVKSIELKEVTLRSIDDDERRETTYSFTEALNVIQKPQTTENKRILGIILLTGSGDGGLFEESTGPINLIEEESTIVSPDQISRRRARIDDDISLDIPKTGDEIDHQGFTETHFHPENDSITVPSREVSWRRGRVDDEVINPCDDCDMDISDTFDETNIEDIKERNSSHDDFYSSEAIPEVTVKSSDGKTPITNQNEMAVTMSTSTSSRNLSNFQLRTCIAARECNATLNERCVTVNSSRVCGCTRGFVRHTKSSVCVAKKIVEATINFPREKFEEDLKNNFSLRYQEMIKNSRAMMWSYLKDSPELLSVIAEIEVNGFKAGSLIVTYNLIFADVNKSQEELSQHVRKDLQKALSNENLLQNASLNAKGAALISTNGDVDPCKSSELNYCSANAYCIWNGPLLGRYICLCRNNYNDASADSRYTGETCIAQCPPEHCGSHGYCEILANNEKHCLCSGLYFGRRCEVPGLYVLIILGIVSAITLTVLVVLIFRKRCRSTSYGGTRTFQESQETNRHSHTQNRVSDVIALEETAGATVSKFTSTNTPVPPPAIKIIRPTVDESSLSFDYDSSFDTPSVHRSSEGKPST